MAAEKLVLKALARVRVLGRTPNVTLERKLHSMTNAQVEIFLRRAQEQIDRMPKVAEPAHVPDAAILRAIHMDYSDSSPF